MTIQQQLAQELSQLSEAELVEVVQYVEFLKCRSHLVPSLTFDESSLAALYGQATDEDRELAETGMSDFAAGLAREDTQ